MPDDSPFAQIAQADKDWRQLCASAHIEGFAVDPRDEVLAGRYLAGDITQEQWAASILADHQKL